jgi:hypothetical protein
MMFGFDTAKLPALLLTFSELRAAERPSAGKSAFSCLFSFLPKKASAAVLQTIELGF